MGNDMVSRSEVYKQGFKGVVGVGGGIGLLVLAGVHNPIAALVIGGAVAVLGLVLRGDKKEKVLPMLVIGAGVLTALSAIPGIGILSGFLLGAGGLGLLITGGISLYQFIKNLKARS